MTRECLYWVDIGSTAHSYEGPLADALQTVGACWAGSKTGTVNGENNSRHFSLAKEIRMN